LSGWLSPLLICASLLFLGRSFYIIYVLKTASRTTAVITWSSLAFIIVFWSVYLASDGFKFSGEASPALEPIANSPKPAPAPGPVAKGELKEIWLHVPDMKERLNID
jgi:amino acid transporter